jgi:hypothetical protein
MPKARRVGSRSTQKRHMPAHVSGGFLPLACISTHTVTASVVLLIPVSHHELMFSMGGCCSEKTCDCRRCGVCVHLLFSSLLLNRDVRVSPPSEAMDYRLDPRVVGLRLSSAGSAPAPLVFSRG